MNIAEFQDLLYGRGLAERTVREYRLWVRRASRYAADQGYTLEALPGHLLRQWADRLPHTWATRKQARSALRHYYRAVGRADEQPWEAIRQPAKPKPRPQPHEVDEARLLRDAAVLAGGRAGLCVLLLLYTGARANEVAAMRWEQVDLRRGVIRFDRPKVSDEHELPLQPPLRDALERARPGRGTGPLFSGNNGRDTVAPATVWAWTRQIAQMAGVEATPKRLRSTLGNRLLELTGDLDAVAGVLGHRSVDTTRSYYTDTAPERTRRTMDALDY